MEIVATCAENKATVVLSGKLTVQASSELTAAIEDLPADVCDFDVDLTDVSYIASAGLRLLVAIDKRAVNRGGRMRLLNPASTVLEVFEMTGLSEVFAIERTCPIAFGQVSNGKGH